MPNQASIVLPKTLKAQQKRKKTWDLLDTTFFWGRIILKAEGRIPKEAHVSHADMKRANDAQETIGEKVFLFNWLD